METCHADEVVHWFLIRSVMAQVRVFLGQDEFASEGEFMVLFQRARENVYIPKFQRVRNDPDNPEITCS